MEILSRTDKEGNVYSITPGIKNEQLALPSIDKLKVAYEWKTNSGKFEVNSKVLSLDATLTHGDLTLKNLLSIQQTMDETTVMKSYFKKGWGFVASAMVNKQGKEQLIFYVK